MRLGLTKAIRGTALGANTTSEGEYLDRGIVKSCGSALYRAASFSC
jgi:hypothetical protein